MSSAVEKKADAFIIKLAASLTSPSPSAPLPTFTQPSLSTHFQQTLSSLPPSKLQSHLLTHLPRYSHHLFRLYCQHLPPPAPTLLSRSFFPLHLSYLTDDPSHTRSLFSSLLLCSHCSPSTLHAYLAFELSQCEAGSIDLDGIRRALSTHRSPTTLLSAMAAVVDWMQQRLSQTSSPCLPLSSTLSSLLFLFQCQWRLSSPSATWTAQYVQLVADLLALQLVWSSPDSVSTFASSARYALALPLPPPAAVNTDAEILLLYRLAALRADPARRTSIALTSSPLSSTSTFTALLTALAPGITRTLAHSTPPLRTLPILRLALLHSAFPTPVQLALTDAFRPLWSTPVDARMSALMKEAGVDGAQVWVEEGVKRLGEARVREVMERLEGRVGDRERGDEGEEERAGVDGSRGDGGGVDGTVGWVDDRVGSMGGLDGQLQELIAGLKKEKTPDAQVQVQEVESMLHTAGEPQPSQLTEVSDEDEPPQPVSEVEEEDEGQVHEDEGVIEAEGEQSPADSKGKADSVSAAPAAAAEAEGDADGVEKREKQSPKPPSTERKRPRAKAEQKRTSLPSPRHTRAGTKL